MARTISQREYEDLLISNPEKAATFRKVHVTTLEQMRGMKIQRNEPCPCGSRWKFKKCCGLKIAVDKQKHSESYMVGLRNV